MSLYIVPSELRLAAEDAYVEGSFECMSESGVMTGTKIKLRYSDDYESVLDITQVLPEKVEYRAKDVSWYYGRVIPKDNVTVSSNFCVNKFNSYWSALVTEKRTAVVGMSQGNYLYGKNSKVLESAFDCTANAQSEFPAGFLDTNYQQPLQKALEANKKRPPYDQKSETEIRKKIADVLIAETKKNTTKTATCPEGTVVQNINVDLDDNVIAFQCKSAKFPLKNLCPENSTTHYRGMVSGGVDKSGVSTIQRQAEGSCTVKKCIPGTLAVEDTCIACPKGTSFSLKETKTYIEKMKSKLGLAPVVCTGPHDLVPVTKSEEPQEEEKMPE